MSSWQLCDPRVCWKMEYYCSLNLIKVLRFDLLIELSFGTPTILLSADIGFVRLGAREKGNKYQLYQLCSNNIQFVMSLI